MESEIMELNREISNLKSSEITEITDDYKLLLLKFVIVGVSTTIFDDVKVPTDFAYLS